MIKNYLDLAGRNALITGAAGNLGLVFSSGLAELGANLILIDTPNALMKLQIGDMQRDYGVKVFAVACDLEDQLSRNQVIRDLLAGPPIDILINNAAFVGTSNLDGWISDFKDQSVDTWRRAIEVNLTAPFDLIKGLTPKLMESVSPSVINIGSTYASYGPDYSLYEGTSMGNPAAYAASKGGLVQLTRWLATTLSPHIRVNAISPGGIFRNQPVSFVEKYSQRTPLKRMATESDIVGAVIFLASDLSKYVTGQNLAIDGGWGVW
jgi:NAD(P)-dependent dehydrogenase (short-subunit alcohol dehydrogenase family)